MLCRLRTVDARDQRERTERNPFCLGICNDHDASHQDDVLRMTDFVHFAAGEAHDKRLKGAAFNPCLNCVGVHSLSLAGVTANAKRYRTIRSSGRRTLIHAAVVLPAWVG